MWRGVRMSSAAICVKVLPASNALQALIWVLPLSGIGLGGVLQDLADPGGRAEASLSCGNADGLSKFLGEWDGQSCLHIERLLSDSKILQHWA